MPAIAPNLTPGSYSELISSLILNHLLVVNLKRLNMGFKCSGKWDSKKLYRAFFILISNTTITLSGPFSDDKHSWAWLKVVVGQRLLFSITWLQCTDESQMRWNRNHSYLLYKGWNYFENKIMFLTEVKCFQMYLSRFYTETVKPFESTSSDWHKHTVQWMIIPKIRYQLSMYLCVACM